MTSTPFFTKLEIKSVGRKISNYHYHGEAILGNIDDEGGERLKTDVSIFYYDKDEAIHVVQSLIRHKDITNCNVFCIMENETSYNKDKNRIVVMEQLDIISAFDEPISTWLTVQGFAQLSVHRFERRPSVPVLAGSAFRNIFRSILIFLRKLHKKGDCHGRLQEGIFIRRQSKCLVFANFGLKPVDVCPKKEDFKSFVSTIETLSRRTLNDNDLANSLPLGEWGAFVRDVNQLPDQPNLLGVREDALLIYHHYLSWDESDPVSFIHMFLSFSRTTTACAMSLGDYQVFDGWWRPFERMGIPSRSDNLRFYYDRYNHNQNPSSYGHNDKIIDYWRNCLTHSGILLRDRILKELKMIWPTGINAFYDIMRDEVLWAENRGRLMEDIKKSSVFKEYTIHTS